MRSRLRQVWGIAQILDTLDAALAWGRRFLWLWPFIAPSVVGLLLISWGWIRGNFGPVFVAIVIALMVLTAASLIWISNGLSWKRSQKQTAPMPDTPARVRAAPVRAQDLLDIRVASPANRASEHYLEWIHLECEPTQSHFARNARPSAVVGDQHYELVWQTDEGPRDELTLYAHHACAVPLLLCNTTRGRAWVHGREVVQGLTYVTDRRFFRGGEFQALSVGEYTLQVTVDFGDEGQRATRAFRLNIAADPQVPIRIRRLPREA